MLLGVERARVSCRRYTKESLRSEGGRQGGRECGRRLVRLRIMCKEMNEAREKLLKYINNMNM